MIFRSVAMLHSYTIVARLYGEIIFLTQQSILWDGHKDLLTLWYMPNFANFPIKLAIKERERKLHFLSVGEK